MRRPCDCCIHRCFVANSRKAEIALGASDDRHHRLEHGDVHDGHGSGRSAWSDLFTERANLVFPHRRVIETAGVYGHAVPVTNSAQGVEARTRGFACGESRYARRVVVGGSPESFETIVRFLRPEKTPDACGDERRRHQLLDSTCHHPFSHAKAHHLRSMRADISHASCSIGRVLSVVLGRSVGQSDCARRCATPTPCASTLHVHGLQEVFNLDIAAVFCGLTRNDTRQRLDRVISSEHR